MQTHKTRLSKRQEMNFADKSRMTTNIIVSHRICMQQALALHIFHFNLRVICPYEVNVHYNIFLICIK